MWALKAADLGEKELKIYLLTSWAYPHIGGVSSHMATLAKGLRALGHTVVDIGINHLGAMPAMPTYIAAVEWRLRVIRSFLSRLTVGQVPQVVHFHDCFAAAALLDGSVRLPALLTCHGYPAREAVSAGLWVEDSLEYDYVCALERRSFRAVQKVITPDRRIADYVDAISGVKAVVMRNFVDTEAFSPARDRSSRTSLGLPSNQVIALCPRRLTDKNGVVYAVEAMRHVTSDVYLLIVGDGEQRKTIEDHIERYGLHDRVSLAGATTDIKKFYDASDLVIIPSVTSAGVEEATSMAALEAMACALPVVCTSVGGLGELFEDREGALLVPQRDPGAIAAAVDRLAQDVALRTRVGEAGRKKVISQYSHLKAARVMQDVYMEVLHEWSGVESPWRANASFNWRSSLSFNSSEQSSTPSCPPIGVRSSPGANFSTALRDWEVKFWEFLEPDYLKVFKGVLSETEADTIWAPVVYDIVEEHPVARWEELATRRGPKSGRSLYLDLYVRGGDVPSLPYQAAYECFAGKRYDEALALFSQHFQATLDIMERAVYLRWIALCLLELGRDQEGFQLLKDAVDAYPDNSDLWYLYGIFSAVTGSSEETRRALNMILLHGESTAFPEFFRGIQRLALERLSGT